MPEPTAASPLACDVLVVGAGPAGSACAQVLASEGFDVLLVDQHVFPRDKVCGDGLIPDAHAALARLGVLDQVMARAQRARHVGCIGPRGGRIDVPGALAVLPRRELDHILCQAAVHAGARPLMPARFDGVVEEDGHVVGARLKIDGGLRELRCRSVVLATGAVPQALIAAGVCERHTPSGIALRGYVKNDAMVGRITELEVVWHKRLKRGYGWIFPCRDGVFNIGVGLAHSHSRTGDDGRRAMQDVNLREMFSAFTQIHAPAGELMRSGTPLGELKGAPLRCSLEGAQYSRPGLLVTGEAAGSTYAFTGEGIGKAMETGMLAARADRWPPPAARRRGCAPPLRGFAAGAEAALRPLRARQPRQQPPVARRPADLAREEERAHPEAHGRRAQRDQQPGQSRERARSRPTFLADSLITGTCATARC
jgi:geranylgeranyl reductase family protein